MPRQMENDQQREAWFLQQKHDQDRAIWKRFAESARSGFAETNRDYIAHLRTLDVPEAPLDSLGPIVAHKPLLEDPQAVKNVHLDPRDSSVSWVRSFQEYASGLSPEELINHPLVLVSAYAYDIITNYVCFAVLLQESGIQVHLVVMAVILAFAEQLELYFRSLYEDAEHKANQSSAQGDPASESAHRNMAKRFRVMATGFKGLHIVDIAASVVPLVVPAKNVEGLVAGLASGIALTLLVEAIQNSAMFRWMQARKRQ